MYVSLNYQKVKKVYFCLFFIFLFHKKYKKECLDMRINKTIFRRAECYTLPTFHSYLIKQFITSYNSYYQLPNLLSCVKLNEQLRWFKKYLYLTFKIFWGEWYVAYNVFIWYCHFKKLSWQVIIFFCGPNKKKTRVMIVLVVRLPIRSSWETYSAMKQVDCCISLNIWTLMKYF